VGEVGWCNSDAGLHIASICRHQGEEPVISGSSGICNVFFSHCNLQCIFCQNEQISNNASYPKNEITDLNEAVDRICLLLDQGCRALGFVSPTHFLPHMLAIIEELHRRGYHPIVIYNSNGFDRVEQLKTLENVVDIYLPDFKYAYSQSSEKYSKSDIYTDSVKLSLKEMFRQKGATLRMQDEVHAESGLIIRHLVLPGHSRESKEVLRWIAEELSPRLHLSLMSQYHPCGAALNHPQLGRALYKEEYQEVVDEMKQLGFTRGWAQDLDSSHQYLPDFDQDSPFEN
jgi:putative pyruvate formate lyase activating enzyme